MKQVNGWNRQSPRGGHNYGRGGRGGKPTGSYGSPKFSRQGQNYGGHYKQKTSPFFDMIKDRISHTFENLSGRQVIVKKTNGAVLEGVLITSDQSTGAGSQCTLQNVKVVSKPDNVVETVPTGNAKLSIPWSDMIFIHCENSGTAPFSKPQLKIDSDIAGQSGTNEPGAARQLQAPDAGWLQNSSSSTAVDGLDSNDNGAWDQFQANAEKFGVKCTYDENLYTTKLDKSSLTQEQITKAERTAKEIESELSTNVHQKEERNQVTEGDDVDEETKYSAVARSSTSLKSDRAPQLRNPSVQAALNQNMKPVGLPPLNFAEALKKGKQLPVPPPPPPGPHPLHSKSGLNKPDPSIKTPLKEVSKEFRTASNGTSNEANSMSASKGDKPSLKGSDPKKVPLSAKMQISDVWKTRSKPAAPRGEDEEHQRKVLEKSGSKSRQEQIEEFKRFSSDLERKKTKQPPVTSAKLNVHAKEFKPPQMFAEAESRASQQALDGNSVAGQVSLGEGSQTPLNPMAPPGQPRQGSSSNMSVTSGSAPQFVHYQGGMPMHFQQMPGGNYPMNMMQPVMLQQQGQNGQMQGVPIMHGMPNMQAMHGIPMPHNMMFQTVPGQPYFVQMMPQFQQPQMIPQQGGQPRFIYNQIPHPNSIPGAPILGPPDAQPGPSQPLPPPPNSSS